jgi:PPOX class probable FMN-dependent enzyme
MTDSHRIETTDDLQSVIGEPMEFLLEKVVDSLDENMRGFIARSPLVFVSTIDRKGLPDVSPKGDPAGFVQVDGQGNLLIPERPGNRLTFGFHNILNNGQIGLIFVVPNERETLRVKGRASLRQDPEQLEAMAVKGKPALLYTHVDVTEAFFHCGKAMIRSKMWQPDSWGGSEKSAMVRQLASRMGGDDQLEEIIDAEIEKSYVEELY